MVGASNVFNQIFEKDLDKKMLRTQNRPLPDGRIQPKTAMYIGVMLTLIGVVCLYLINLKTAFFACISTFLYACLYTPLKQKTPRGGYHYFYQVNEGLNVRNMTGKLDVRGEGGYVMVSPSTKYFFETADGLVVNDIDD